MFILFISLAIVLVQKFFFKKTKLLTIVILPKINILHRYRTVFKRTITVLRLFN